MRDGIDIEINVQVKWQLIVLKLCLFGQKNDKLYSGGKNVLI